MKNIPESFNLGFASGIEGDPDETSWNQAEISRVLRLLTSIPDSFDMGVQMAKSAINHARQNNLPENQVLSELSDIHLKLKRGEIPKVLTPELVENILLQAKRAFESKNSTAS